VYIANELKCISINRSVKVFHITNEGVYLVCKLFLFFMDVNYTFPLDWRLLKIREIKKNGMFSWHERGTRKELSPWRKSNPWPSIHWSNALTTEQVDTTSLHSPRVSVAQTQIFSLSHAYDKLNIPSSYLSYFFPSLKFTTFLSLCEISSWRARGYYYTCH